MSKELMRLLIALLAAMLFLEAYASCHHCNPDFDACEEPPHWSLDGY